jgi:hypothetical protein
VKTDFPRAVTAVGEKMLLKSGAAKVGRRSRRVNDNRRQIPVALEINTLDVENRLDSVTCQKRLGFVAASSSPAIMGRLKWGSVR